MQDYEIPICQIKGIGEKKTKLYCKLGIETAYQLIRHFPRDYLDFTKIVSIDTCDHSMPQLICACLKGKHSEHRIRNNLTITKLNAKSSDCNLLITFFNARFTTKSLQIGKYYHFYGHISVSFFGYEMESPVIVSDAQLGRLYPVYRATSGLSSSVIARDVQSALLSCPNMEETLPDWIQKDFNMINLQQAFYNVHHPNNFDAVKEALRRFSFEDLLITSLALKTLRQSKKRNVRPLESIDLEPLWNKLKYIPTKAQYRAAKEVCGDLCSGCLMNRMIQGDVGSGKTLVAAAAAYIVGMNQKQTVLMSPTEILAIQHYHTLQTLFESMGLHVILLTGGMGTKQKKHAIKKIETGEASIIVGTHALLFSKINYHDLCLTITDEQQRFGVVQRASVRPNDEVSPHVLVMSATPIPRTLSLILHGDLDVSVLDEMPLGRKKIYTYHITSDISERAWNFIKQHIKLGRQAYVVCPLIESEDITGIQQAVDLHKKLSLGVFSDCKVDILHGKMKSKVKADVMSRFVSGECNLLITTAIVEVGVDVPNATIMVIQNAERFGLSQLHQLRGRVGRGKHQSYCILVSDSKGEIAKRRLEVLTKSQDGFFIAEQDLILRGPGDLIGIRQHGQTQIYPEYVLADSTLLTQVNRVSESILNLDPMMDDVAYKSLKIQTYRLLKSVGGTLN